MAACWILLSSEAQVTACPHITPPECQELSWVRESWAARCQGSWLRHKPRWTVKALMIYCNSMHKRLNQRKCWLPTIPFSPGHQPSLRVWISTEAKGLSHSWGTPEQKTLATKWTWSWGAGRRKGYECESTEHWVRAEKNVSKAPRFFSLIRWPLQVFKIGLCRKPMIKRPPNRGTWTRNVNVHKSKAGWGDSVLDCNSPQRLNVSAVPQICSEEGSFSPRGLAGKAWY